MDHDRERDARLAEHVMGWRRVMLGDQEQAKRADYAGYRLVPPGQPFPDPWVLAEEGTPRHRDFWDNQWPQPIPSYSTDAAAAMTLIDRITPELIVMPNDDWVTKMPISAD